MMRYIKGIYSMNVNGGIVIETSSGIGMEVFLPMNSPIYKYSEGDSIMVYTSMIVKEDDMKLYGFHNRESLEIFELLITVSGVGAKGAMAIVGTLSSEELKRAIAFEDAKEISKAFCIKDKKNAVQEAIDALAAETESLYSPAEFITFATAVTVISEELIEPKTARFPDTITEAVLSAPEKTCNPLCLASSESSI